jgi:hypothetical protein
MALGDVELFLRDYANDTNMRADWKDPKNHKTILDRYKGLSELERAMLMRGDTHEIKDHMKDSYGAALSVNFP